MKPSTSNSTRIKKTSTAKDAIALLRADHAWVKVLFAEYAKARSHAKKQQLVAHICTELGVHAQVEEELFYPAVKLALKDKKLVPEAFVEHATLKALIAQVEGKEPIGELFDAKIKVLSEYVNHHVKEEQNEMFPKLKASSLDLVALGAKMSERKSALISLRNAAVTPVPMVVKQHAISVHGNPGSHMQGGA